ncbi:MAG: 4Fe-4S binding protein [Spirochaetia bacterium]|jgi:formate hydrogenlyase subunit 6/NADH:ubiquinone oxidoreductase subunit I
MAKHRALGTMIESVLGSLFKKPATMRYPFEKFRMPKDFRGQPKFKSELCTGCRLCIRDCPSQAITITKIGEKKFEASIDLGKCVYCAQCAETCPRKVIDITTEFELTQLERGKLKVTFHADTGSAACTEESAGS